MAAELLRADGGRRCSRTNLVSAALAASTVQTIPAVDQWSEASRHHLANFSAMIILLVSDCNSDGGKADSRKQLASAAQIYLARL